MMNDLRTWLEALDLGRHADLFVENDIDLRVLPHITDAELADLGLPLGARRRIQLQLEADARESGPAVAERAASEREPAPSEAERRQVTVMFCDLVGSTQLSSRLDEEAYRELLRSYQDACAAEIRRHHGHVAQFLGDGVMAYFGWPRAHEDDVGHALRAALGLQAAAPGCGGDESLPLEVRIGLATGPVVIGDIIGSGSSQQAAVTGETPNRAARVQGIAAPGEIAVDESTQALAAGRFEFEPLGTHALKGIPGECALWRVLGERRAESRFAAARGADLTPLIGRGEELELLVRRWRQARAGAGAVVLIAGEPGIGKSRLTRALEESIADDPHARVLLQCSARHTNSALHPVIHQLEFDAGIAPEDDAAARFDKLERLLSRAGPPAGETVALVGALLSVADERHPLPELTAQRQKERTLDALVNHLAALSARAPALLVLEDAHWIDPTSLEFVDRLLGRIRELPLLMVFTYRPSFAAPWVGEDHVTLLTLNRLSQAERARMAEQLTGTAGEEVIAQIAERSDGIPLFIEELARSACQPPRGEDDASPAAAVVPATLRDALEARFDRSPAVRAVAQAGAAIGRTFGHALIAHLAALPAAELDAALADLVESGVLFASGTPPDTSYSFRHALIQDTAYGTLLRSKRGAIHGRIAEALSGPLAAGQDAEPEVIAHHFTEAGDPERAIPLWREAGEAALVRSAYAEATAHLHKALELLRALPEAARDPQQELGLLVTLGPAIIGMKGMASPELAAIHARAIELADAAADWEAAFRARWGSWQYVIQSAPYAPALRAADELAAMASNTDDAGHKLQALHAQWTTAFFLGNLQSAHEYVLAGVALYEPEAHACHAHIYGGHDPGACAMNFGSTSCWLLGRTAEGKEWLERGLAHSADSAHGTTLAFAHYWHALSALLWRAPAEAAAAAGRALAVAWEHAPSVVAPAALVKDLSEAACEPERSADPALRARLLEPSVAGLQFVRPLLLSIFAQLRADAGRLQEAAEAAQLACDLVAPYESFWCEAEVLRQHGEVVRLAARDEAAAERSLREALGTAQGQGARALALRCAVSLASLLRDQGRAEEGRALLAPAYDWWPADSDSGDLRAARALLAQI